MVSRFNQTIQDCIGACTECHDVCVMAFTHCAEKGGKHAEASHLNLLRDCAELCHLTADFMLRGSEFQWDLCRVCAEVCARGAANCRRIGDDEEMRRCAEICDACAATCRYMSSRAAA